MKNISLSNKINKNLKSMINYFFNIKFVLFLNEIEFIIFYLLTQTLNF